MEEGPTAVSRVSYYSAHILPVSFHRSICSVPIHSFSKQLTSKILLCSPREESRQSAPREYRTLSAPTHLYLSRLTWAVSCSCGPFCVCGYPGPGPRSGEGALYLSFSRGCCPLIPAGHKSEGATGQGGKERQLLTSPRFRLQCNVSSALIKDGRPFDVSSF